MAQNKDLKKRLGKSLGKIFGEEVVKEEVKQEITSKEKQAKENTENQNTQNMSNANVKALASPSGYMVNINLIQPNKQQPRKNFDEEKLQELTKSIKDHGIITPLIVKKQGSFYEIIGGERRWRAAKAAGLLEVPVVIKELDKKEAAEIALIENIQREDLNAVEEALAYQSLIDEFGLTQEEVASRVSKNRTTITNALRILKLNDAILDLIKTNQLSSGHARALLSIEDASLREKIAKRVIDEKLSVRDIEKLVRLDDLGKFRDEKRNSIESKEQKQLKIIYKEVEKELKQKMGTKVKIVPKTKNTGKIEIEYYSQNDLDRIINLLKTRQ